MKQNWRMTAWTAKDGVEKLLNAMRDEFITGTQEGAVQDFKQDGSREHTNYIHFCGSGWQSPDHVWNWK
jgi:hypothetical protein